MSPQGSPGSPGPRGPPVSHNLAALIHLIILGSTAVLTLFTVYIIFLLWFWSSKTVYSSLSSSQLLIIDRLSLQLDVLMSVYVFVLGSKRSITARTERREGTETVYRVNVAPPSGSSTRPRPRNMTSHWPRPLHITALLLHSSDCGSAGKVVVLQSEGWRFDFLLPQVNVPLKTLTCFRQSKWLQQLQTYSVHLPLTTPPLATPPPNHVSLITQLNIYHWPRPIINIHSSGHAPFDPALTVWAPQLLTE